MEERNLSVKALRLTVTVGGLPRATKGQGRGEWGCSLVEDSSTSERRGCWSIEKLQRVEIGGDGNRGHQEHNVLAKRKDKRTVNCYPQTHRATHPKVRREPTTPPEGYAQGKDQAVLLNGGLGESEGIQAWRGRNKKEIPSYRRGSAPNVSNLFQRYKSSG